MRNTCAKAGNEAGNRGGKPVGFAFGCFGTGLLWVWVALGLSCAKRGGCARTTDFDVARARTTIDVGPLRRSVCAPFVLEEGVRLPVKYLGPRYVRAKNLECATPTLRYWRFKTRFFASFLFAFEKK